jgi:outer membrane receptor protein involved in Fe transport
VLAADSAANSEGLQEIVVTARKRTENLQDVPQSIDVYTTKDLQEPRDLAVRGLRLQDAVGLLHQHRSCHADVFHARRFRWQ